MSLNRLSRLLVSGAAATALTAGGLAVTATPAQAATATGSASYTCVNPLGGLLPGPLSALGNSFTLPAKFTLQNLPETLTANVPVPAGVPIVGTFSLPSNLNGGLLGPLVTSLSLTLNNALGGTPLAPVSTQFSGVATQVSNGEAQITGTLGAFTPSADGLPLPIPTSFDASLLTGVLAPLGVKCTYNPGTAVFTGGTGGTGTGTGTGGISVAKQGATIKAKGKKKIKLGQKAVVTVKVKTSAGQKGVGQVKVKAKGQKAKVKNLKNGKIRFVIKKLRAGKQKIKFTFLGNSYTNAAKKSFVVRVMR
ncbi:hypothetical protein [Nocardioides flavescens]|uniref:Bacterial Ig-like domain-containing protein n=1 Tax=Nocardioides flavescens TaxID=2691959 RepID=A0A6L7EZ42_9ACTN|nr:hypothetical protein [Nocardioides flavescens]MXG89569.1 hypothetical protein [Nocardioides flavescens]